jgi:hypothetical protein
VPVVGIALYPVIVSYSLPFSLPGSMKGLAFIKDPDGYWIEILKAETIAGSK